MLMNLFDELSRIQYLQGYSFKPEYADESLYGFELVPEDSTLSKAGNVLKLLPADLAGKSVLDIGCNKGFFSFECLRRGASRVVGVDVIDEIIDVLRKIQAADPLFSQMEFHSGGLTPELARSGPFDLIIFMSAYHYLYAEHRSHEDIFAMLARACKGAVILELPLELDDKFAAKVVRKQCRGEDLAAYNTHAILDAAARSFGSVRYIANSGFLRTRDIFLLELPGADHSYSREWEGKPEPWSLVRGPGWSD